ncbi:hypothetical protein SSCG_00004 [Streptomyces clavuligerus]|nr:hypothetical protein SSCG_00004 [Streptomyces clavuligerus]
MASAGKGRDPCRRLPPPGPPSASSPAFSPPSPRCCAPGCRGSAGSPERAGRSPASPSSARSNCCRRGAGTDPGCSICWSGWTSAPSRPPGTRTTATNSSSACAPPCRRTSPPPSSAAPTAGRWPGSWCTRACTTPDSPRCSWSGCALPARSARCASPVRARCPRSPAP